MKALVTGGAGFIGSHLVDRLIEQGDEVAVIDIRSHVCGTINPKALYWGCGIQGMPLYEFIREVAPDVVFHLAAVPGVQPSWKSFRAYAEENIVVTQMLLHACVLQPTPPKFVFASSSSVYNVQSPYGASKVAGEALVDAYRRAYGLNATSLRFFTVYGPRQRPDMAFQKWMTLIRNGDPIVLYGGGQRRDFTYVGDVVTETLRIAAQPTLGTTWDVGYGQPFEVEDAAAILETVVERPVEIIYGPKQTGDPVSTCASPGIPRSVSLEEGLRLQWRS